MYWQRDLVVWRNDLKIFGISKPVDFGKQKGIYILYDHHTVVYVGRTIDRPLGKRLYEHTVDRFSWFGLLDVTQDGNLRDVPCSSRCDARVEALEPPQNRKRGDDFSAIEYIQDIDPELREREIKILRSIERAVVTPARAR
jgi:hypothetical protein